MQRVKGETVRPSATLQLMDDIGPTKAARALGVSTTLLYKARRENTVSRVVEAAASGKVQPQAVSRTPHDEPALLIVEIPMDKQDLLARVAQALGGRVEH